MILVTIGVCLFYILACLGLGSLLLRCLHVRSQNQVMAASLAKLSTAFLLGQGGLAVVWLALALSAIFSPQVVTAISLLSILGGARLAWPSFYTGIRSLWSGLSDLKRETWIWRLVAFATLSLILVEGVGALVMPPIGDAEAFYMAISKVIADSHRLIPLSGYEQISQIGLQGELHYAALMSLVNPEAAKLFVWPTSLALTLMLLAIGSQVGIKKRGQWIMLAILFTSTAFIYVIPDGKVDLFGAAMGIAAFYWALRSGESHDTIALRLAGLFGGLAVVAKFSNLVALVPSVLFLIVWQRISSHRDETARKRIISMTTAALSFCFWMLPAIIPHLFKNALLFSQPLAPFIAMPGQAWLDQIWFSPEVTRRIVMTYPLALVFGQYPMQYGNLSPLLLAFAPLAMKLPQSYLTMNSQLVRLTIAALLGVILWVILRPSIIAPRYILATLLAFIPLAACGAGYVVEMESTPRWLSIGILICLFATIGTVALPRISAVAKPLRAFAAGQAVTCNPMDARCRAINLVNQRAMPGDRVYLGTWYRYWLRPDLLQCISNRDDMTTPGLGNAEAQWTHLYERGFRYLIYERRYPYGTSNSSMADVLDASQAPAWLAITPLLIQDDYVALHLESRDPSRLPLMTCRQVQGPAWDVVKR